MENGECLNDRELPKETAKIMYYIDEFSIPNLENAFAANFLQFVSTVGFSSEIY